MASHGPLTLASISLTPLPPLAPRRLAQEHQAVDLMAKLWPAHDAERAMSGLHIEVILHDPRMELTWCL